MAIATLKKRFEFQRVRGGDRWSGPAFLMEGKTRPGAALCATSSGAAIEPNRRIQPFDAPRFGFTITRKLGNAVTRNRMRRRIKAALADVAGTCADPHFDYVIVARPAALNRAFVDIRADLEIAFRRIHSQPRGNLNANVRATRSSRN